MGFTFSKDVWDFSDESDAGSQCSVPPSEYDVILDGPEIIEVPWYPDLPVCLAIRFNAYFR